MIEPDSVVKYCCPFLQWKTEIEFFMNRKNVIVPMIVILALIPACSVSTVGPSFPRTIGSTQTPIPFSNSSLTPTFTPPSTDIPITATTELGISPGCMIIDEEGQWYMMSDREFHDLWSHVKEMDRALAANYPEWALYKQTVPWDTEPVKLSEIINSASLNNELNLQINSKVVLVTLGISMDWQLPADSDLFLESRKVSLQLNDLAQDWERPGSENIHAQYPKVANAATYAFYLFYDKDLNRLRDWCNTYQIMFGTVP